MKKLGLAMKFMLPVGAVLIVLFATLAWTVSSLESNRAEKAFQEQLTSLAMASRWMFHSEAESYCKSIGMAYHRVQPGTSQGGEGQASFERSTMEDFAKDASIRFRVGHYKEADGTPILYVLAPGTFKEECNTCHEAFGISATKGRKPGDLVAGFGVSVSTAKLVEDQRRTWVVAMVVAGSVLALLALILRGAVGRIVLRPLGELSRAFEGMAKGDLRVNAAVRSEDEIGGLAATFNHMTGQLRQTLGDVTSASEQVASGSTQLAASADEMAKTVELTARVGEELRESGHQVLQALQRLNANVEAMAGHTGQTRQGAHEAMRNADLGTEAGRGAAEGMAQIQEATANIAQAVQAIQGIARQTNLLSLNAAIEAAKAGAQGKGFAVVAEEVRKLAERSSQAAREIEEIIVRTQDAVAGGRGGVDATLERLEAIRSRVADVTGGIAEVGALSDEQAGASAEVAGRMNATAGRLEQNAAATQELSATVTQIARTSEELSRVAEGLKDVVQRFKL
jgi:methyl-accepting chemotaxis protein